MTWQEDERMALTLARHLGFTIQATQEDFERAMETGGAILVTILPPRQNDPATPTPATKSQPL